MAANSENRSSETFRLFSSFGGNFNFGFGFYDSPAVPPPPPCVEVLPTEASSSVKYTVEPVNLDGLTLLKGRVSTKEVFALSNSDLVPGKYEGGLKLWEGSLDLVKALRSEVGNGHLSFTRKRVLELGCGHGLPAIFACREGAAAVHFQDFNAEVLKCLTIPNVNANIEKVSQLLKANATDCESGTEVRFFAGDWSEIDKLLSYARDTNKETDCSSGNGLDHGYDIVLMAETVYSTTVLQRLYQLIKKCVRYPNGVVYMSAKKHYFGVGGGTRQFLSMVEKDGLMAFSMVAEVADGSSNVREVWKLSFK
ncbi:histidine protein methyltransferase 1 homolog [Morus notabilis]|nr:histidine protein methyltransferase 1 homolog [Morus notabilis]